MKRKFVSDRGVSSSRRLAAGFLFSIALLVVVLYALGALLTARVSPGRSPRIRVRRNYSKPVLANMVLGAEMLY